MTIIQNLELHHSSKHRPAKKSPWLSCVRIWLWWRLSNYHITHNWGENKSHYWKHWPRDSSTPSFTGRAISKSITHQARGEIRPIPTLWSHYPEAEEGHTAGGAHGQERRAGRWFGLKFSYPGVSTRGSTPAGSGTPLLTMVAGTNVIFQVRFLSEEPWEKLKLGKIPLFN